jgi:hypothetical protein
MDILVCGSQRSGNTLVANILGSHSKIAIPSGNLFFFTLINNKEITNNPHTLINSLGQKLTNKTGLNFSNSQIELLYKCIEKLEFIDTKSLIDCSLHLYKLQKEKVVVGIKDPGAEKYAYDVLKMYPDCKILHIVRSPFSVVASKKMSLGSNKYKNIDPIFLSQLKESMLSSISNMKKYPNNYLTIKYEDIIHKQVGSTKEICKFLGVEYQSSMLDMSGNTDWYDLWDGTNSSFDKSKFKGISKTAINRENFLTNFEKYYIANKFKSCIKFYNYDFLPSYKIFNIRYLKPQLYMVMISFIRLCFSMIRPGVVFFGLSSYTETAWKNIKKLMSIV